MNEDDVYTSCRSITSIVPLTHGLARNTFFNLLGWVWPVGLSFIAVPYILNGLGTDSYGVFGIISLLAGYLGLLNGPMAMGNVRFMAEAFGRQDWDEFRRVVVAGIIAVGTMSAVGATIIFLSAEILAQTVFKIPASLVGEATFTFKLAAISFFLNGLTSGLNGIPAAMRRYDVLNIVSISVGTLNTAGIVFAIWMGLGLLGAVTAHVLSSGLAVIAFGAIAWRTWRGLPKSSNAIDLDRSLIKRLISFSAVLFGGQFVSRIGLQIDRTLVGVLLGTSAVTYYVVPAKITDQIPGFIGRFTMALYPLSAEGLARYGLDKLYWLYLRMVRLSLFLSGFMSVVVIILARDILWLWVGPDMARNSWLILTILGAAVIFRGPAGVAYQMGNGLGRADFSIAIGLLLVILSTVLIPVLSTYLGVPGVALSMFMAILVAGVTYDSIVQRLLFHQRSWVTILAPYVKVNTVICATYILAIQLFGYISLMQPRNWGVVILKILTSGVIYIGLCIVFGILQKNDIGGMVHILKRIAGI